MRRLAATIAALSAALLSAPAWAETAEALRTRGEQLAKDGRYSEAIDAFKAAERLEPRARHACLIALAYTRRELWPQAEIFLDQCHQRATAADPLPEWVPLADQQLAERLAAVDVAPVELVVEPAGLEVKLAVSSFAPDERFAPRTIHLPPGRHVIIATAPGHDDAQEMVEITDRSPRRVVITLQREGAQPPATPREPAAPPRPASPPSPVPWTVVGAGGAIAVGGALVHALWFKPSRDQLVEASTTGDQAMYDAWSPKFDTRRNVTIALYGLGAAAIATGLVLRYTVFASREAPVEVAAQPHAGGAVITLGWTR